MGEPWWRRLKTMVTTIWDRTTWAETWQIWLTRTSPMMMILLISMNLMAILLTLKTSKTKQLSIPMSQEKTGLLNVKE